MKSVVVSDTGPIISLAVISKFDVLFQLFDEILIAEAVWEEVLKYKNVFPDDSLLKSIESCRRTIQADNYLSSFMDYGESESVILLLNDLLKKYGEQPMTNQ